MERGGDMGESEEKSEAVKQENDVCTGGGRSHGPRVKREAPLESDRRTWDGTNSKRRKVMGGGNSNDAVDNTKIAKFAENQNNSMEMDHKTVKKGILLLGRYFHLKEASLDLTNRETDRRKRRGKRRGRRKPGREREEDENAALAFSSWIASNASIL